MISLEVAKQQANTYNKKVEGVEPKLTIVQDRIGLVCRVGSKTDCIKQVVVYLSKGSSDQCSWKVRYAESSEGIPERELKAVSGLSFDSPMKALHAIRIRATKINTFFDTLANGFILIFARKPTSLQLVGSLRKSRLGNSIEYSIFRVLIRNQSNKH